MSIFPYIYFMVKSFDIASDDKQIAIYAGLVTSSFALAEFFASMIWGRLSDKVGRKPILLTGLAGTGISMLGFGLAPNFFWAVFARALGGLLNGYALTNGKRNSNGTNQRCAQKYWCTPHYRWRSGHRPSSRAYGFPKSLVNSC